MTIFEFEDSVYEYLKSKDILLAKIIEDIGVIERGTNPNIFQAIIDSIISQQLSGKVADIICKRFYSLFPDTNPNDIINAEDEIMCGIGLSYRKIQYIKGVANAVNTNLLDIEPLRAMNDNDVIIELTKLKGIGEWTAEMLLIFSLNRKDILSIKDLGIRKGLEYLYGENVDYQEIKSKFSPYNTLLSFYLWEIAGRGKEYVEKIKLKS